MSNPVAPPPPPANEGGYPPPAAPPKKKSAVGRILLRVGLALVVLIIGIVVKEAFFGDKAKDAAVGDCIAASKDVKVNEETNAEAKVVECSSSDAAFSVVGRVNGETNTKSKSCDKFFKEGDEFYVYSSEAKGGYLLCLKPKA